MTSLQSYEIWKRKKKKRKLLTGSKVVQLGQTANSGVKIMQPRTTGPYLSPLKQFSFSFQSCWLEVSDIFWLSNLTPLPERSFLPRPLGRCSCIAHRMPWMKMAMMAALIRPEMGTVTNQAMKMFLNRRQSTAFLERSHPTATTEPTWKHSSRHKHPTSNSWLQIIHQLKLHNGGSCSIFGESTRLFVCLPHSSHFPHVSVSSTDRSIWPAYLAVGGGDRQANVRSYHHSQGWGQLDAETTAGEWETTPMSS